MRAAFFFLVGVSWSVLLAQAAGAPPSAREASPQVLESSDAGSSLQQLLDAIEATDRELTEARQQLKNASASDLPRVQARIQELGDRQEQILQEMERIVGPLPPKVVSDSPIPLEERLKDQEKRHETVLESDVERRLPR